MQKMRRFTKRMLQRAEIMALTRGRPFYDRTTGRRYRRVYHFHVRKSAGTSLNTAFWKLCKDSEAQQLRGEGYLVGRCEAAGLPRKLVMARHDVSVLQGGRYHMGYSHQPCWGLELPSDTFTLTIIRDPLRRLQSYYRYLMWVRHAYTHTPEVLRVAEPSWQELLLEANALGPVGEESLQNLVERAAAKHVVTQLWMFSEELDPAEAAERIVACSAVMRTENFVADLAELGERLGLPLGNYRERSYDNSGIPAFTPADIAAARDALVPEYAMLDRLGLTQAS